MKSVVIGTAGHIDHGKSALVMALTGTDPDRLKEEQARGITIDLGFAHFIHGDTQVGFVDVPGHERFVRNMLAGAGGIDAVLLVIDAGESVKAQTREHFEICRLLGIDRGLVALTKIDVADGDGAARARRDARALVAGSFLEGAPMLEVSARSGAGLAELRTALVGLAGPSSRQQRNGIVRLPVDRAFTVKGFGAVVTGTLVSGVLRDGDSVVVLPEGRQARVRGLQIHGKAAASADASQRVAVNLAGLDARDLRRGQTLATDDTLTITTRIDVRISLLAGVPPLRHGARVRVHCGSGETTARVSIAATRLKPVAVWSAIRPRDAGVSVPAGGEAFARLTLEAPMAVTRGDRIVLRSGSPLGTIGGAVVLDPEPPLSGVRRDVALPRFEQIDQPVLPVASLLTERAELGLTARDLIRRFGFEPRAAYDALDSLIRNQTALRVDDRVVDEMVVRRLEERALRVLEESHRSHPLESGLTPGALRDSMGHAASEALAAAVISRLATRGLVVGSDRLALASHAPQLSTEQQKLQGLVEGAIRDGALAPPDAADLANLLQARGDDIAQVIQWLLKEKRLVRAGGLLFHADALGKLKGAVQSERAGKPAGARVTLDVGTFKSRFNLTRKHAIPLLEWLDRERVTRRAGDVRIVL